MGTITLTLPTSHFFKTQGNLFLPIIADLAVYALFRRARDFHVSEIAGAVAGLAVGFCLYDRASPLVTLTGAGLYAAYKVIHYIYVSLDTSPPSDEEQLEEAFDHLKDKVTIAFDLDASNPHFDQTLISLTKNSDVNNAIRIKWKNPAILRVAEELMFQAYKVIRQELQEAEEAILNLTSDRDSHNAEIVENLGEPFYSAFKIFYETYRHVHNSCYHIRLHNLQNVDEGGKLREFSVDITDEDREPFVLGVNPKYNMKQLYVYVNDLLAPLFEHFPNEIDLEAWKKELPPEYPSLSDSNKKVVDNDAPQAPPAD